MQGAKISTLTAAVDDRVRGAVPVGPCGCDGVRPSERRIPFRCGRAAQRAELAACRSRGRGQGWRLRAQELQLQVSWLLHCLSLPSSHHLNHDVVASQCQKPALASVCEKRCTRERLYRDLVLLPAT